MRYVIDAFTYRLTVSAKTKMENIEQLTQFFFHLMLTGPVYGLPIKHFQSFYFSLEQELFQYYLCQLKNAPKLAENLEFSIEFVRRNEHFVKPPSNLA